MAIPAGSYTPAVHPVSLCARLLKNNDPSTYDQFLSAVSKYADELTVTVTEAAPADILVSQGQARQARKFLKLLTELPQ